MDIPVISLSATMDINLKQMIGDRNLPAEENPNTYYVM
ncbi:hypothetical protein TEGAF0_08240 [Sediminibacterium sp. TEGAF015]|nr:hypothetical protein TEGAF0_08240 [Sediminibacterium sp. TEGAF015]